MRASKCQGWWVGLLLLGWPLVSQAQDPQVGTPPYVPDPKVVQQVLDKLIDWRGLLDSEDTRKALADWIYGELTKLPDVKVTKEQIEAALDAIRTQLATVEFQKLSLPEIKSWLAGQLWDQVKGLPEVKLLREQVDSVVQHLESAVKDLAKNAKFSDLVNGRIDVIWQAIVPVDSETILKYQPTPAPTLTSILTADHLSLALDGSTIAGEGKVSIVDPFGYFKASDFKWNWENGAVSAQDIGVRLHPVRGSAKKVTLDNQQYFFEDLNASFLAGNFSVFQTSARDMTLRSDDTGVIHGLSARLLGIPIARIKEIQLDYRGNKASGSPAKSLLQRIQELSFYTQFLRPPSIGRSNGQVSYGYSNTITVGNLYQLGIDFKAARHKLFQNEYTFNYNLSKKQGSDPSVLNESTVREDFTDGFVENVDVRNYRDDLAFYRQPRSTILANSSFNVPYGLPDGESDLLSKPYLVGYEFGGPINRLEGIFQVRYERVQSRNFGDQSRTGALGSIAVWGSKLMDGLNLYTKIDASGNFPNGDKGYGFVRPRVDLVARFLPWLRVSGAFTNTHDFGSPFIPFDAVIAGNEIHARLDILAGPLQISYGNRYAFSNKKWYRAQIFVSQVIGAFEPFVMYDQYLNALNFGVYFRLDDIVNEFRQRKLVDIKTTTVK